MPQTPGALISSGPTKRTHSPQASRQLNELESSKTQSIMCQTTTTLAICPTCLKHISKSASPHWCREARRNGTYGRCLRGIQATEEEFRDVGCDACRARAEEEMDRRDVGSFAERTLGGGNSTKETAGEGEGENNKSEDEDDVVVYMW